MKLKILLNYFFFSYFQFLPFPSEIRSKAWSILLLRVVSVLASIIHEIYSFLKEGEAFVKTSFATLFWSKTA